MTIVSEPSPKRQLTKMVFRHDQPAEQEILPIAMKEISEALSNATSKFVSQGGQNVFKHGKDWSVYVQKTDGSRERSVGEAKRRTSDFVLKDASVADGDFTQVNAFIDAFSGQMANQMEQSIISEMIEATSDRPALELKMSGDLRPGLLAALESIPPCLNDDLTLAEPSFVVSPSMWPKLEDAFKRLESDHPDFKDEVAMVKRRRHIKALINHFENISNFRLNNDERRFVDDLLQRLRELRGVALHSERCRENPGESREKRDDLPEEP